MKKNKKKFGQSIVEFALVLTVFITLMLGVLDWGFYLYSTMIMDTAVRDAVRFAVTYSDWSTNSESRTSDIQTIIADRTALLPANIRSGITGRVAVSLNPDQSNIESITVAINAQPFETLTGFLDIIMPDTITTRATMRYERR